jgi:hypothetical protein
VSDCSEKCWTPVPCPICGCALYPAGRSVPMAFNEADCCAMARNSKANTRHLWDEHDSTRHYTDPAGWAEHERTCAQCRGVA